MTLLETARTARTAPGLPISSFYLPFITVSNLLECRVPESPTPTPTAKQHHAGDHETRTDSPPRQRLSSHSSSLRKTDSISLHIRAKGQTLLHYRVQVQTHKVPKRPQQRVPQGFSNRRAQTSSFKRRNGFKGLIMMDSVQPPI